jgi:hypothetical protein
MTGSNVIYDEQAYAHGRKARILMNAMQTFCKTFERGEEVVNWLDNATHSAFWSKNEFVMSMARAIDTYGKLTEKQYQSVCGVIDREAERMAKREQERNDKRAAEAATLEHIGVVGERMQFELTVDAVIEYDRPKFHYHDIGIGYITIMHDAAGNKVAYMGEMVEKGKDNYGCETWRAADKGDIVLFMAKVKEHCVRDGVKQTIVQRPTKIVIIVGEAA